MWYVVINVCYIMWMVCSLWCTHVGAACEEEADAQAGMGSTEKPGISPGEHSRVEVG